MIPSEHGLAVAAFALLGGGLAAAAARPAWVVGAPRLVLGLVAAVSLAAGAALVRCDPPALALSIDASSEPLLPRADPGREAYRRAVRDFGGDEVYVIALVAADVFRADVLLALRQVGERIGRLPGVIRVESLADVISFRYVPERGWIEVSPFVEAIPEEPAALAALRRRALADPLYRRSLVSEDGRAAALNVHFRDMSDREFIAADLDGRVAAILAEAARPGLVFHVAGRPHVKSRVYHQMLRDLRLLIPLAIAVMAGLLALLFGSLRGVLLPLASVLTATLWTFAAMALLERPLTVLTTLLAPTLIATGSVYGVHVVSGHEEAAAHALGRRAAALRCAEAMRLPVVIAGLTTMCGFGALCISDVPAVFELGAFAVLGIASVTLLSLTALPAALALLPPRARDRRPPLDRVLLALLRGLARTGAARSGTLLALWSLPCAVALVALPAIVIDTDYLSFFRSGSPVRRDFQAVNRLLSGAVPLFVTLEAESAGRFRDPEVLRAVEALQARLDALPGVSRTHSLVDTLRVLNRAVEAGDPGQERIPDTRAAIAELLYLIPKHELQRLANVDHSRSNILVRTGEVGSAAVRTLGARILGAIADTPLPDGIRADVTGNALLLSRSADAIAGSQPLSVGMAALAIFALVSAALGSVRLGLVAMVPNAVPVLLFFGALGLGAAALSLPTSLIGSTALGVAVDATVHYLVRYRAGRRAGLAPAAAAGSAGLLAGRPIAIGSIMLCLGFAVVALSSFATLQQFGILCAATMAVCLATDLLLLPALLVRLRL